MRRRLSFAEGRRPCFGLCERRRQPAISPHPKARPAGEKLIGQRLEGQSPNLSRNSLVRPSATSASFPGSRTEVHGPSFSVQQSQSRTRKPGCPLKAPAGRSPSHRSRWTTSLCVADPLGHLTWLSTGMFCRPELSEGGRASFARSTTGADRADRNRRQAISGYPAVDGGPFTGDEPPCAFAHRSEAWANDRGRNSVAAVPEHLSNHVHRTG